MRVPCAVIFLLFIVGTAAEKLDVLARQGRISEGTVLQRSGVNHKEIGVFSHLYLAIDDEYVVYMRRESCLFSRSIWLTAMHIHEPNQKGFSVVSTPSNYNPKRSVAMARALLTRHLPYAFYTCNEYHWMKYIIYGQTHNGMNANDWCPLALSLKAAPVDITPEFALMDRRSNEYRIKDFHQSFLWVTGYKGWPRWPFSGN